MTPLADGLMQLRGFPPHAVNIYLAGDILIDAGTRFHRGGLLRQLRGRQITAHALTHAHPDHQGSSRAVCRALGLPFWVPEGDVCGAESPEGMFAGMPEHWVNRTIARWIAGPGYAVDRRLREGDTVGGFTVLETPGHSPGHVSYWREADRVLIAGDVLANMNPLTGLPGLHEPPTFFSTDPARNRDAARRLAKLEPALVCFGHGAPLRDTRRLIDFVAALPGG